jgi:hypothetical protein
MHTQSCAAVSTKCTSVSRSNPRPRVDV